MLEGKLRTLTATDPDPYPDAVHIELDVPLNEPDNCRVTIARKRKKPTAIQKAVQDINMAKAAEKAVLGVRTSDGDFFPM